MNEERKNQQAAAEPSLSEILQVRRDKLKALQDAGRDPFVQTRFERSAYSADIKNDFDAYDGKTLQAAGRIMSKRGMGKAIFCDLQDVKGRIQIYVRIDELGEELAGKATVAKVNVDDNKAIASQFRVMSIPTVIFFVDGVEKERLIGVQPKQKYIDTLNSL